jgi:hypothetical protein
MPAPRIRDKFCSPSGVRAIRNYCFEVRRPLNISADEGAQLLGVAYHELIAKGDRCKCSYS